MTDRWVSRAFGIVLAASTLAACGPAEREEAAEAGASEMASDGHVVRVTARDYAFQLPDSIPSGWTTFRMENQGMEHHFMLLNRLPDDRMFEDYSREVVAPFDTVWHGLKTGVLNKEGAVAMLGRLLPAWYASVRQMGGPGLVAPGGVAQTTVELEPGTYVIECYVKTKDGTFHTALGMQRELVVTSEPSGGSAPAADVDVRLSNGAIETVGALSAGAHTVAVHFDEHPAAGLGNDVHVVRLEPDTDLDQVTEWMDWLNLNGLRAPAPARFVGGTQEMPVGHTAYFTVELEPGRYAWITETDAARGMVKEFSVE